MSSTWTPPVPIDRSLAEQCLAAIKTQFATFIEATGTEPKLYPPGHEGQFWAVSWEGGPYEWTMLAFHGGLDEDTFELAREFPGLSAESARTVATVAAQPCPAKVFAEPVNSVTLGLYRA